MSYINAEKVLPEWLVGEIRNYVGDGLIYIPPVSNGGGIFVAQIF